MVNEARVGYNRTHSRFAHSTATGMTATEFGFVGLPDYMNTTGGLPLIDFSNYNDLGTRNFRPAVSEPAPLAVPRHPDDGLRRALVARRR